MKIFYFLPVLAISFTCSAQVQVRYEPRHHNVFENEYVRILDVHLPPGDTTQVHIHSTPSAFITLRNVHTGSQVFSQDPADTATIGSNLVDFTGFYHQPRIHRVYNSDTREYRVMDIELLKKEYQSLQPPMDIKGMKVVFDEKPARGYELLLAKGEKIKIADRNAPLLLVNGTEGSNISLNKNIFRFGGYTFVEPHTAISLVNKGDQATLALLELK